MESFFKCADNGQTQRACLKTFLPWLLQEKFILSQECLFCVTPCSSKAPRDEEGKNYFHTSQADGRPAERYSSEMVTELMRLTHMKIIW